MRPACLQERSAHKAEVGTPSLPPRIQWPRGAAWNSSLGGTAVGSGRPGFKPHSLSILVSGPWLVSYAP